MIISPKEKAEELVKKFYYPSLRWGLIHAKECATKTVDEILINFGSLVDGKLFYTSSNAITFWEEVKKEIELV